MKIILNYSGFFFLFVAFFSVCDAEQNEVSHLSSVLSAREMAGFLTALLQA